MHYTYCSDVLNVKNSLFTVKKAPVIEWVQFSIKWALLCFLRQLQIRKTCVDNDNPTLKGGKISKYKTDQESIRENAVALEHRSEVYLVKHATLSRSVTLFQIAIAISAIAILTRKRFLWYFGILLALIGIIFFIMSYSSV